MKKCFLIGALLFIVASINAQTCAVCTCFLNGPKNKKCTHASYYLGLDNLDSKSSLTTYKTLFRENMDAAIKSYR